MVDDTSKDGQTEETPNTGPAEDRFDRLVDSFSRSLGELTRTLSENLSGLASAFTPPDRRQPVPEEDLGSLLERLGQLVSAHQAQGYSSLERDAEFWELLGRLIRARRHRPARRVVQPSSPGEEEAVEAMLEPAAAEPSPEAAKADAKAGRKRGARSQDSDPAAGEKDKEES